MRRLAILLTLALTLTACGPDTRPTTSGAIAVAADRIDAAEARYQTVRAFAFLLLPLLPDQHADRIRALDADIVAAFDRARRLTDAAARAAALKDVLGKIGALERASGAPY